MSHEQGYGLQKSATTREHLDGITKMTGSVDFGSTHCVLTVTLAPDGGSTAGTSEFQATSAVGQIPANALFHQAVLIGNTLTCSALVPGESGKAYPVKVNYILTLRDGTRVPLTLTGTIQSAPASGPGPITLVQ